MWMNQAEIEMMAANRHACPNVKKGVKLLYAFMQAVNDQSDGWPYWNVASKSAAKLMELLSTAGNSWHDTRGTITEKQLKDAITPIRRMVTAQQKKSDPFIFDVDAALREDTPKGINHVVDSRWSKQGQWVVNHNGTPKTVELIEVEGWGIIGGFIGDADANVYLDRILSCVNALRGIENP
jgi:hypothetical protein